MSVKLQTVILHCLRQHTVESRYVIIGLLEISVKSKIF
jgi:hypothetical protein